MLVKLLCQNDNVYNSTDDVLTDDNNLAQSEPNFYKNVEAESKDDLDD